MKYKAALHDAPIFYVNPDYTSQVCSRCGSINKPNGKNYKCLCSYFDPIDSNAIINIFVNVGFLYEKTVGHSVSVVRHVGGMLNQSSEKRIQLESSGGAG